MNLTDITTNLRTVIAAATTVLVAVDDGAQEEVMEAQLNGDTGAVILIHQPQGYGAASVKGGVAIRYSTTVWIRTNPKATAPTNPLTVESAILSAVLQWSKTRNDGGFALTPDLEPETDFTDVGNNSRLVRFTTTVLFQ